MRICSFKALLALLFIGIPLQVAHTNPFNNSAPYYVGAFGGVSITGSADFEVVGFAPVTEAEVNLDTGFITGFVAGKYVTNRTRFELELAVTRNDVEDVTFSTGSLSATAPLPAGLSLDVTQYAAFANIWQEFEIPKILGVVIYPFVGGGVGIALSDIDAQFDGITLSDNSTNFAFQFGAGITAPWAIGSPVDLEFSYRLRGLLDSDLNGPLLTHNLLAGARYKF